ncbi:MAG: ABC transporter ATP-binding protein [Anaerocolumna sp.]
MKQIIYYLKPYGFRMLYGFLIKVLGTFMDLGLPWVLAYIIDEVIPLKQVNMVLLWGLIMLLLSIGARVFNIMANRMASRVAADSVRAIRHDLFKKILDLSGSQVDRLSIPSLVSRMTSDTYNIHHMVGMMQRLGVRAPIILIGGIIITSTLEPVLTLILIGILPLLGIAVYWVSKKGIPLYTLSQSASDKMIRVVRENITGIRVIKALSKSSYENRRFQSANDELVKRELKAGSTMATINPIMNLLLNVGLTLVVVFGAYRVNSGASEVGKIVAFLSYFTMILTAVMMITKIFVILSKATASAGRISEVLNSEDELITMSVEQHPTKPDNKKIHIEFDHVTFKYTTSSNNNSYNNSISSRISNAEYNKTTSVENDSTSVENITFQMKQGESLGIIGATGSGKTTLINLLMRYYDITKGGIYMNGRNIKTIPLTQLRQKFGVVFQNDTIFADSILGNINLNRGVSLAEATQAAEDAQAAEFIHELESTYDYSVAIKGANLSGGQKQRLLIARALADKPEILVLDDSSSALDYKTDAKLRNAIRNHYKNTTTIMVAQRISSIMYMDQILVMEDGKIIGQGKHEDLLENCGVYHEIYQSQMGSS